MSRKKKISDVSACAIGTITRHTTFLLAAFSSFQALAVDYSFEDQARTSNQLAIARLLDKGLSNGLSVCTTAGSYPCIPAQHVTANVLQSIAGVNTLALAQVGTVFANGINSQLQGRMAGLNFRTAASDMFANGPILLASNRFDVGYPQATQTASDSLGFSGLHPFTYSSGHHHGFWTRISGSQLHTDTDNNADRSKMRNISLTSGYDQNLSDSTLVGVAYSYGTTRLGFDNDDKGRNHSHALAVYGSYVMGSWNYSGTAAATWNRNSMTRHLRFGSVNEVAQGNFKGQTLAAYVEAAYTISMNGWKLQPLAGLSLTHDKTDAYSETGAGIWNMQVQARSTQSTQLSLGTKAIWDFGALQVQPRASWEHDFSNRNKPLTAQLQGTSSLEAFQVLGVALSRNTMVLGISVSGDWRKGLNVFGDAQFSHNSKQRSAGLQGGLRWSW